MVLQLSRNLLTRLIPRQVFCSAKKMSSATDEVIMQDIGDKGVIVLNRPKILNSLNLNMIRIIYPKLRQWENTKKLVIIKGAGVKAFCAGGDIRNVTEAAKIGDPEGICKSFFGEEYLLNCLIGTLHIPYVALIDGITMGGGVGLSVLGQIRVATEKTMFAMPETAIGLFPDVGGGYFLPRLGGRLGMYLALTGHRLKGRDVLKAGVATHCCDSSRLEELEGKLLALESTYPEDVTAIVNKFSAESTFDKDKEFSLKPLLSQINKCFSGNSVEQILKNLEEDGSEWAKKQIALLRKMSPTSLKVTHAQLERGAHMTLQEVLQMEYRIVRRIGVDHDFTEGVRALLVDKDQSPKWKPATIEEVSAEALERHFAPLQGEPELDL